MAFTPGPPLFLAFKVIGNIKAIKIKWRSIILPLIRYHNKIVDQKFIYWSKYFIPHYSKDNNQKIELTILSEDEAIQIFNKLAAREDIPHGYPEGCYARAHEMVRSMNREGIVSGKAFIEGEFYVDGKYGEVGLAFNVAPVVMVKTGNKVRR